MKKIPIEYIFLFIILFAASIKIFGFELFEATGSKDWRYNYDIALRWLNFAILVYLLVKYGKNPLMSFLKGQKDELAEKIDQLEKEKELVKQKTEETKNNIKEGDAYILNIKEKIVAQGKKEKERIINEAQAQSELMLENAKRKIESYFHDAKKKIRYELIDEAISIASRQLPQEITSEDSQKYIDLYLNQEYKPLG